MADWIGGLLLDLARYLRDAIFNWGMFAYGVVVTGWEIATYFTERLREPEDYRVLLIFGALVFGSIAAYRKARRVMAWDENALRIEEPFEGDFGDPLGGYRYMLRLSVYAKRSIPQPNRIRLWFTERPRRWNARPVTWVPATAWAQSLTKREPRDYGREVGKRGLGQVRVRRRRMDIEYLAPPLDGKNEALFLFLQADRPISLTKAAAYCETTED